ncbi:DUF2254 domain-containing protein [Streptomyces sp. NBC_01304]|uniref:DUF2254 domain-containing protein n=1 Tax=Streptomyces sp. NBC_01304 TaxID=2903818 RepID=UPI002E147358|nr:DUF2254 domain-containing protein [Streptomyces sp. NBC_01304]
MAHLALRRRRVIIPRLRKKLRSSFLVVPFLGIACGWFLASGAVWVDEFIHDLDLRWDDVDLKDLWFLRATQDFGAAAKTAVGTMSSAMLTFIGVVFSITLVALQMAAGQFTPRVVRIYVESWVTKTTLAVFLCTFLYTLRIQKEYATVQDAGQAVVPYLGASLGMGFVVVSLVLFVIYVHSTIRLMRVTYVMDRVAKESLQLMESAPASQPTTGAAPLPDPEDAETLAYEGPPGVLQAVDARRLVRLAERDGTRLRLVPRVGDFLSPGIPLLLACDGPPPTAAEVRAAMDVGVERTNEQDLGFGLRQLADIASRALSPAVNDPTTAVQALDRIQVLLAALAPLPLGRTRHRGEGGVVRLVESVPTWQDLVDLALTEIREFGAACPQVTRRIAACLDDLEQVAADDHRPVLAEQRRLLQEAVRATVPDADRQRFALTPDRQGIG